MINDNLDPERKQARDEYKRDKDGKFATTDSRGDKSSIDKGLVDFVNNIDSLPDKAQYIVGDVSDRERKDIERLTGDKLNATSHVINASEIRHIQKRHGVKGLADESMAEVEDIAKIGDVIKNYDNIELLSEKANFRNGKGQKASIVLYHKAIDDKTQIVAEAITDGAKGVLRILTAYKTKKHP